MSRSHVVTAGAFVLLFSILGYLVYWLIEVWMDYDASVTGQGWTALILGVLFSLIAAVGLTALLIISNRRGYDEPPHFQGSDRPPKHEP